jgi:hypothetical protein
MLQDVGAWQMPGSFCAQPGSEPEITKRLDTDCWGAKRLGLQRLAANR